MVYLFLANGFEEIEALCPVDLMRRAGIDVVTVGIGGKTILGAHDIPVTADKTEEEARLLLYAAGAEMVVLPGGMPGSVNLAESETVHEFLSYALENNIPYAAICAAPMVLGKYGMVDGKSAVCYPGFEEKLVGASISFEGVAVDGNCITGRAMGSANEFALALVAKLRGRDAAEKIKAAILL